MKREKLETYLGKLVEITLFDGDVQRGVLTKTEGQKDSNLYTKKNCYFCSRPRGPMEGFVLFKTSHVVKIKDIEEA